MRDVWEYDEPSRSLIATNRLSASEYGASAIIAHGVRPEVAQEIIGLREAAERICDDHESGYAPSIGAIGALFRAIGSQIGSRKP